MSKRHVQGSGDAMNSPAAHYTFVKPSPGRRVLQLALLFTLLALVYTGHLLATVGGQEALVLTVIAAVLVVTEWAVLQAWVPQRIEVDKSVITITRNGESRQYDLVDPGVEIRVRDGAIAFAHYMEPWSVVRASEVKWQEFLDVLMHYQSRADINAELRDQRFSA